MNTISTDTIIARLAKKHPVNYSITASESNHCVLGYTIYAYVELQDEKLMYSTDKAGRLRVIRREKLTPTYKSVRLQPHDSAVIIRGGKYDGQYIVRYEGEGWLKTTTNVEEVKPMRDYYAKEFRNYIDHHVQYCYRGQFEVVNIGSLTNRHPEA